MKKRTSTRPVAHEANPPRAQALPNPAAKRIEVRYEHPGPALISLHNTLAQQVLGKALLALGQAVDISGIAPGCYIVRLQRAGATVLAQMLLRAGVPMREKGNCLACSHFAQKRSAFVHISPLFSSDAGHRTPKDGSSGQNPPAFLIRNRQAKCSVQIVLSNFG
ncbi:MAG TPA: T9SS type A sorting domain-containing protein, partial [Saprospiraceae bacterium]|nr:T9SS type A sorting domain-containing protein [Saprospiraceae bacterium]